MIFSEEWSDRFASMMEAHRARKQRRAAVAAAIKTARAHGIGKRQAARMARLLVARRLLGPAGLAVQAQAAAEHAIATLAAETAMVADDDPARDLDPAPTAAEELEKLLSPDERRQAARDSARLRDERRER